MDAENFAAQCIVGDDNEFCLHLATAELFAQAVVCSSVTPNSTCTEECQDFLESTVDRFGCCFYTTFNERLSPLLLGRNVEVSLDACNVTVLESACENTFDLTVPSNADSCTYDEFWSRTVDYVCRTDIGQAYIDALLQNSSCTPLARHQINACSRGTNNTFCLDLFGGTFDPVFPLRTVYRHPELNNAITLCANYSTFASSGGCPAHCQDALETAIDVVGCCINLFNDTINEVTLPHFSGDVLTACGVESPGTCESDLTLGRAGSATVKAITAWIYICLSLALLYGLN